MANERYLTPAGYGTAEFIEKRSRFIGQVWLIENEAEALEHIAHCRETYWDAGHNVFCYRVREGGIMRYSDDGEPHGTSGVPTLNVLKMSGAMDLVVVVTRYFGGILLGAGGLVRAYSAAAKLAIDEAGLAVFEPWNIVGFTCSYSDYQKITAGLPKTGAVEEDADFGEDVTVTAAVKVEDTGTLMTWISETTGGRSAVEILDTVERAAPIGE